MAFFLELSGEFIKFLLGRLFVRNSLLSTLLRILKRRFELVNLFRRAGFLSFQRSFPVLDDTRVCRRLDVKGFGLSFTREALLLR